MQFLIGPVELRPRGEHVRVLQVAKCRLHLRLSAIGFDDLRRTPFRAIADQNTKFKIAIGPPPVFLPIASDANPYLPVPLLLHLVAE